MWMYYADYTTSKPAGCQLELNQRHLRPCDEWMAGAGWLALGELLLLASPKGAAVNVRSTVCSNEGRIVVAEKEALYEIRIRRSSSG